MVEILRDSSKLFDIFENVYLFGSSLWSMRAHDIDLLLVYNGFSTQIEDAVQKIQDELQLVSGYYIDITVLSYRELIQTDFLKNIKYYKKIK